MLSSLCVNAALPYSHGCSWSLQASKLLPGSLDSAYFSLHFHTQIDMKHVLHLLHSLPSTASWILKRPAVRCPMHWQRELDSASYGVSPYPTVGTHVSDSELPKTFSSQHCGFLRCRRTHMRKRDRCDAYAMTRPCVQTISPMCLYSRIPGFARKNALKMISFLIKFWSEEVCTVV
jgi:hypothetical protein